MIIGLDISVLSDKRKTGIGVYTYNLIENLLRINSKDKFILFGIATLETYQYLKNLPLKNYPNVKMKIYRIPAKSFRTAFLIWQKINWPPIENFVGQVDIFHSFNWYLPPQGSGKVIATVFDMTPKLFPKLHQPKTIQSENTRLEKIKKDADLVITISQNSKKDFLKFAPGKKVEVIYPAAAKNFINELSDKRSDEVMKKYNLTTRYILSVGTLEPRKNIGNLIKAFLKSGLPNKLVLVGVQGWESGEFFKLLNENRDKIVTLGFVADEDLPYIYNRAFCLIYPSLYEGFGIPVLEAQACGCPVITSNNSSLPEVGGRGAVFINPNSVDDMVKGMERVKREGERVKLVKAGYENIKRFSWEESAEKLNLLYQQLLVAAR